MRRRFEELAGATGLEPAASCVTGRRSNQLNYAFACDKSFIVKQPSAFLPLAMSPNSGPAIRPAPDRVFGARRSRAIPPPFLPKTGHFCRTTSEGGFRGNLPRCTGAFVMHLTAYALQCII
jgi:hypothetical protein